MYEYLAPPRLPFTRRAGFRRSWLAVLRKDHPNTQWAMVAHNAEDVFGAWAKLPEVTQRGRPSLRLLRRGAARGAELLPSCPAHAAAAAAACV